MGPAKNYCFGVLYLKLFFREIYIFSEFVTMRFSQLFSLQLNSFLRSNKTGFGPYRLHRRGEHFVGTEPSVLKYHHVSLSLPLLFIL